VKKRKDGEGKKLDEDAKKAKADADRLTPEIAKLEKDPNADADVIAAKKKELAAAKETIAKAEQFRQETAEMERQAKLYPEIGRRLLQAEVRLLPPGKFASVTSPIGTK